MALPPREVPEGLSAEGYLELGQEYIKIGWTEQARDALQFAVEFADLNAAAQYQLPEESLDDPRSNDESPPGTIFNSIAGAGAGENNPADLIKNSLADSSTAARAGFHAESRLQQLAGKSAARLLRSKIPKFPVPLYAEQMNIEGHNQMSKGNLEAAKDIFQGLIHDYPDFEWPYGNLSVLLLQAGETAKAKALLDKALLINSFYVQGWLHLATARGLELDFDGARECVERALAIDPTEGAALAVKDALDRMRDL